MMGVILINPNNGVGAEIRSFYILRGLPPPSLDQRYRSYSCNGLFANLHPCLKPINVCTKTNGEHSYDYK